MGVGVQPNTWARYERGELGVPETLAILLRTLDKLKACEEQLATRPSPATEKRYTGGIEDGGRRRRPGLGLPRRGGGVTKAGRGKRFVPMWQMDQLEWYRASKDPAVLAAGGVWK